MSPRGFEEDRKREQDRAAGHICSFLPNLPPSTGTSSSLSYPHIILRPLRRRRVNIPSIHGKVAVLCPVVQMTELQRDKERIYSRSGLRPEPKAPDLWLMVCLLTQHTSPKSYGWSLSFDHHKLPGQNSLMVWVLKDTAVSPALPQHTDTYKLSYSTCLCNSRTDSRPCWVPSTGPALCGHHLILSPWSS